MAATHALALLAAPSLLAAFSPYEPTAGWRYYLEAAHPDSLWPACDARFLSFPASCDGLDLWSGAGANQQFELEEVFSGNASSYAGISSNASAAAVGSFRIKLACGNYISYSETCGNTAVGTSPVGAAVFRLTPSGGAQGSAFAWSIEAAGRAVSGCSETMLSFAGATPPGSSQGERHRGFRGSLEPPGPLLTHLHTVYMAYSECLPTRLTALAERTCFSQAAAAPAQPRSSWPSGRRGTHPSGCSRSRLGRRLAPPRAGRCTPRTPTGRAPTRSSGGPR
jgi:hypothetical protein